MTGRLEGRVSARHLRRQDMRDVLHYPGKRAFDIVVASLLLVVLSPVMLAAAVAVGVTSPGGAVFRQTRVGALKRPFVLLKFRTMVQNCSHETHEAFVRRMMAGDDPRPEP